MASLSEFSIVILAGGLGTRLLPAVSNRPKVLAKIQERFFITFLLDQLIAFGAESVILATGYKGNEVAASLGSSYKSLQLIYSMEQAPLGTGGALRCALPFVNTDDVLVMNGDSFIDADMGNYIRWYRQKSYNAALLLTLVQNVGRYGRVELRNEVISCFEEKGVNQGPGLINAGVYLFNKSIIKAIPPQKVFSLEHDLFPKLLPNELYGYCDIGAFIDIGTPDAYSLATAFFDKLRVSHLLGRNE